MATHHLMKLKGTSVLICWKTAIFTFLGPFCYFCAHLCWGNEINISPKFSWDCYLLLNYCIWSLYWNNGTQKPLLERCMLIPYFIIIRPHPRPERTKNQPNFENRKKWVWFSESAHKTSLKTLGVHKIWKKRSFWTPLDKETPRRDGYLTNIR